MRGLGRALVIFLAIAALWPGMARAVDLTGFDTDDQDKKLRFVFSFSETVEAQVVNNYANNFVDIGIANLAVPRDLSNQDHEIASEETAKFCRFTRFMEIDGERHIRIYLGKHADPSDVQVVQLDNRIEVELVKPFWKLPPEEAVATTPDESTADDTGATETADGFIPDSAVEESAAATDTTSEDHTFPTGYRDAAGGAVNSTLDDTAGLDTTDALEDTGITDEWVDDSATTFDETDETEPFDSTAEADDELGTDEPDIVADQPDSPYDSGEVYGETSLDDLANRPARDTEVVTETNGAEIRPVHDLTGTPSYRQFDLDDVPVAQVQLRNLPFNEALMELVAGSGFNVVVGSEVSDEVMTLDFRQKEVSLKRALDLLCMAYSLTYIVEDDAIIVNQK